MLKLSMMWQMDNLTKTVLNELLSAKSAKGRDHWVTLLDSPVLNQLPTVRIVAIQQLSRILDLQSLGAEKVLLARKYQVSHWLLDGLRELLKQEDPWSEEDEAKLGLPTVSKLYRIREDYYKKKLHRLNTRLQHQRATSPPTPRNLGPIDDGSIDNGIVREFSTELDSMKKR